MNTCADRRPALYLTPIYVHPSRCCLGFPGLSLPYGPINVSCLGRSLCPGNVSASSPIATLCIDTGPAIASNILPSPSSSRLYCLVARSLCRLDTCEASLGFHQRRRYHSALLFGGGTPTRRVPPPHRRLSSAIGPPSKNPYRRDHLCCFVQAPSL